MEQETYKPKLRITTLSENGTPLSDRLVDAYTELNAGPKVQHKGPIRVEVTLTNQQEISSFKDYLDKLVGNLPIKVQTVGRGRPSSATTKELDSPREDILAEVEQMVRDGKTQQDIIKYLRGLGFVFILTEDFLYYFKEFEFEKRDIGDPTGNHQFPNSLSWMARCIKRAKDPRTDKFDPMILFGFSILQGPSKKVVPYLYKERKKPLRVEFGKRAISFSQAEFTKLPVWMLEDERIKFSTEQRQLLLNPEKKPSKFFLRWVNDAVFPDSIKDKIEEIKKR